MSLASDIRNLPPSRRETVFDALAETAAREMEKRGGSRPAGPEREPHKSSLGVSEAFSEYYGGAPDDRQSGRNRETGDRSHSRMGVSDSFVEEAEKMKHTPWVVPRSRFGMPGAAMVREYGSTKGFEHQAFCEQAAAFVKADNQEAFDGMMAKASPEELKAFNKFLDAQKG